MEIKIDCKYYLGYKPCKYHKLDARLCSQCKDYRKIEQRILIVKLDALGDVLRTTAILPALHEQYPNASITWVTRKNAIPLLENNPYILRKYAIDENFIQYVLREKFDIGICLDADPNSATILALANCNEKFGFITNDAGQVVPANREADKWYMMGLNDKLKRDNRLTYQRIIYDICKLKASTYKPQLNLDPNSIDFANNFAKKNNLGRFKNIIGVNTGGGNRWELKKWILDYYVQLIQLINLRHPNTGVLLFGGPEEVEFNKIIVSRLPDLIDTGCRNSLMEFAGLISLVDVFITPDSLGMHMSIALDKLSIVLVGPTSPWELDVYGRGEIVHNTNLECIACYLSNCDKKTNCMNTLAPEYIYQITQKYL